MAKLGANKVVVKKEGDRENILTSAEDREVIEYLVYD